MLHVRYTEGLTGWPAENDIHIRDVAGVQGQGVDADYFCLGEVHLEAITSHIPVVKSIHNVEASGLKSQAESTASAEEIGYLQSSISLLGTPGSLHS